MRTKQAVKARRRAKVARCREKLERLRHEALANQPARRPRA